MIEDCWHLSAVSLIHQGLIQKEKVDINGEKSAQVTTEAKEIITQYKNPRLWLWRPNRLYILFFIFLLLCAYYVKTESAFTGWLFFT